VRAARRALAWLLYLTGAARAARWLNRGKLVVVCYHGVTLRADGVPGDDAGLHVSGERFRRQLRYLRSRYNVISIDDYREAAGSADTRLPSNPLLITFDDGIRNCLTAALPLLESERLPASFFVITGLVHDADDRSPRWTAADDSSTLSWADVARLGSGRGHEVGSHTASHKWLPALDDDCLTAEIEGAALEIGARLGTTKLALAYPWGGRDARVLRTVQRFHDVAFSTDGTPNSDDENPLELARVLVGDHDSRATLALRVAGVTRARPPGGPPTGWEQWSPYDVAPS
jgi:peptidoglycan/xylan/chitin deacetylase (PgdA/CDA1 family)